MKFVALSSSVPCSLLVLVALTACGKDRDSDTGPAPVDEDGDGVPAEEDCDDNDAALGAIAEDADCDGTRTSDDCNDLDAALNADDVDGDGYSTCEWDCDDNDPSFHPGAGPDGLLTDRDCDRFMGVNSLGYAEYSFVGENSGDNAGLLISSAGDVDGDGLDDLMVGAWGNNDGGENAGKAYLVLGASLAATSTINLSLADYSFIGENIGDFAGAVSSAGDVDGDGLDDLLVGAVYNDDAETRAGKAYLVLAASIGSTSTLDLSLADYSLVGENRGDMAGVSVSNAGDVDGDGLDDLVVGAKGNDDGGSSAGKAYLVLGASLGSTSSIDLALADYRFVGENSNDVLGHSVSSAGDVDGDGLDDLLLGALGNDDGGDLAGKAYLVLGASLGSTSTLDLSLADFSFVGESSGDWAGYSVSSAGDVDRDGLDDLLVGAPYANDGGGSYPGKAYLVLGASLGSTSTIDLSLADYSLVGENSGDSAGISVSSAGDVNEDGPDDLLVGAYHNQDGGRYAGKAYLVLGASLGSNSTIDLSLADYSFIGENSGDNAGVSVSSAGDVNGDGRADLLVGADGNAGGGSYPGNVYLILSGL